MKNYRNISFEKVISGILIFLFFNLIFIILITGQTEDLQNICFGGSGDPNIQNIGNVDCSKGDISGNNYEILSDGSISLGLEGKSGKIILNQGTADEKVIEGSGIIVSNYFEKESLVKFGSEEGGLIIGENVYSGKNLEMKFEKEKYNVIFKDEGEFVQNKDKENEISFKGKGLEYKFNEASKKGTIEIIDDGNSIKITDSKGKETEFAKIGQGGKIKINTQTGEIEEVDLVPNLSPEEKSSFKLAGTSFDVSSNSKIKYKLHDEEFDLDNVYDLVDVELREVAVGSYIHGTDVVFPDSIMPGYLKGKANKHFLSQGWMQASGTLEKPLFIVPKEKDALIDDKYLIKNSLLDVDLYFDETPRNLNTLSSKKRESSIEFFGPPENIKEVQVSAISKVFKGPEVQLAHLEEAGYYVSVQPDATNLKDKAIPGSSVSITEIIDPSTGKSKLDVSSPKEEMTPERKKFGEFSEYSIKNYPLGEPPLEYKLDFDVQENGMRLFGPANAGKYLKGEELENLGVYSKGTVLDKAKEKFKDRYLSEANLVDFSTLKINEKGEVSFSFKPGRWFGSDEAEREIKQHIKKAYEDINTDTRVGLAQIVPRGIAMEIYDPNGNSLSTNRKIFAEDYLNFNSAYAMNLPTGRQYYPSVAMPIVGNPNLERQFRNLQLIENEIKTNAFINALENKQPELRNIEQQVLNHFAGRSGRASVTLTELEDWMIHNTKYTSIGDFATMQDLPANWPESYKKEVAGEVSSYNTKYESLIGRIFSVRGGEEQEQAFDIRFGKRNWVIRELVQRLKESGVDVKIQ